MDTNELSCGPCPIARGLARVGDVWSMLILRNAAAGETRFDQFRASLGIAPNILSRRLAALTADGLLEKRRYNERPPRDEYVLTDAGRDFLPVLYVIGEWARRHHGEGAALSKLVDEETGAEIHAAVVDRATGIPVTERRAWIVRPK